MKLQVVRLRGLVRLLIAFWLVLFCHSANALQIAYTPTDQFTNQFRDIANVERVLKCPAYLYAVALIFEKKAALPGTGEDQKWAARRQIKFGQDCELVVEGFTLKFVDIVGDAFIYELMSKTPVGNLTFQVVLDVNSGLVQFGDPNGKRVELLNQEIGDRFGEIVGLKLQEYAEVYERIFIELLSISSRQLDGNDAQPKDIMRSYQVDLLNDYKKQSGDSDFTFSRPDEISIAAKTVFAINYSDLTIMVFVILVLAHVIRRAS